MWKPNSKVIQTAFSMRVDDPKGAIEVFKLVHGREVTFDDCEFDDASGRLAVGVRNTGDGPARLQVCNGEMIDVGLGQNVTIVLEKADIEEAWQPAVAD